MATPLDRLLEHLLDDACLRELALQPHETLLDVGCGHGGFAARCAAHVVAVDPDAAAVRACAARGLDARRGSTEALPLRQGERFDVAFARFVLESLANPLPAVRALQRTVRPGGRVVLVDDDHDALRLWPQAPRVAAAWEGYCRSFAGDADVGRKLVALLHAAGLRPVKARTLSFGACAGEPTWGDAVARLRGVLDEHLDAAGVAELDAFAARPDAALWYAVRLAEGRR